jgi:hypothetical protein
MIDRGGVDTVTVSDATEPFLTRGFEFEELPGDGSTHDLAFTLAVRGRTGPGQGGRASPFVGRHRELELLSSRLESAMRGQGQIVGVSGEAGIGKSRLLYEFRESLAGKLVTYLEGLCHSYGAPIPYLPVLEVLRASCGITDDDSPGAMADKARTNLLEAGMDLVETAPYLLHLLDIEPDTEGGAFVKAHEFDLGSQFEPARSWSAFRITFQYPFADIYPHFFVSTLRRKDGNPLGEVAKVQAPLVLSVLVAWPE